MTTVQWIATVLLVLLCAFEAFASDGLYRCEKDGKIVLTDRPGTDADCRPLKVSSSNTFQAPPTAAKKPAASKKQVAVERRSAESIADEQMKAKQRCERLQLRLDEIATKMRNGYTLQQGERLNERKRSLEAQQKIERCR